VSLRVFLNADVLPRADGLQSLSYALCHVYARATRSVSIPAPVYCTTFQYLHNIRLTDFILDADIVCSRAKHHYDPQQGLDLSMSETLTNTTEAVTTLERFRQGFRPAHERMRRLMYFC
jgi:eukaryotic translation initiation factor 2C